MAEQARRLLDDYELAEQDENKQEYLSSEQESHHTPGDHHGHHDTATSNILFNNNHDDNLESSNAFPVFQRGRWHKARRYAANVGSWTAPLLPRFLRPGGLKPTHQLHPTSYLDALRGYAAWIVLTYHRFDFKRWPFFNYPIIRTTWAGPGMVDVFFVISGFVLTQSMLKRIRARQRDKLADSLAASVFRRYLRLYIPCALVSFVSMLALSMGITYPETTVFPTFWAQLWHWTTDFAHFCNPFAGLTGWWHRDILSNAYVHQLWTIPVEFRGSMIVYLFCVGAQRLTGRLRLCICAGTAVVAFMWTETYVTMFMAGMFLAEVSLIRHPERYRARPTLPLEVTEQSNPSPRQRVASRIGYLALFLLAFLLLGVPEDPSKGHFPWPYLAQVIPSSWKFNLQWHFWTGIAAPILIFSLDECPMLQKPLLWNFSQYLGVLSFGIYVMHFLIIDSLTAYVLNPFVQAHFHTPWAKFPVMWITHLAVFWIADYFARFDSRVVHFTKWLQDRLFETL